MQNTYNIEMEDIIANDNTIEIPEMDGNEE